MKKFLSLIFLVLLVSQSYAIDDIKFSLGMTQTAFRDFSDEMGVALSYKPLNSAEPLGLTGFDLGVEVSAINISDKAWKYALQDHDVPGYLVIPKLKLSKGLIAGFDGGVMYSQIPDTNVKLLGAELKYAILKGSAVTPAIAIRGTYTQLFGVSELNFKTLGLDASISKGFLFVTPYLGVGVNWYKSTPKGFASAPFPTGLGLKSENETIYKTFAGARINFLLIAITGEVEYNNVSPVFSIKGGFHF